MSLMQYEVILAFKISLPECTTLDSTWSNVVIEPALPVKHGVEITLTCSADHVNKGGNKAICQNGRMVPTSSSPQCSTFGKLSV